MTSPESNPTLFIPYRSPFTRLAAPPLSAGALPLPSGATHSEKNFQVQMPKDNVGTLAVVKQKGAPPAQQDVDPQDADEHDEVNKVFVRNLSYSTSKEDIETTFGECGEIEYLYIPLDDSGSRRGICFIKFTNKEAWVKALSLNETELGGRKIYVVSADHQSKGKRKGKGKGKE